LRMFSSVSLCRCCGLGRVSISISCGSR
jgi:hypothetical protein